MKVTSTIFFLFLYFTAFTQKSKSIYFAVYETEMKLKPAIQRASDKSQTKEDSILAEFSELFFSNLEETGFSLKIIDSLMLRNDSSFITSTTSGKSIRNQAMTVNINFKNNFTILIKNKFIAKSDSSSSFLPVPGSYEKFTFLSKGVPILGYETEIYTNESGNIRIWINKSLPTGINPRIKIANPIGAILQYEVKKDNQITFSTLTTLQRLPQ